MSNDMKKRYREWINKNVKEVLGTCAEITDKMNKEFPELRRVRGHYFCTVLGNREHWWLVDECGEIIDPTVGQFPSLGSGVYREWKEGDKEPTGKCINCGEYTFDSEQICSEICLLEVEKLYSGRIKK